MILIRVTDYNVYSYPNKDLIINIYKYFLVVCNGPFGVT